MIPAGQGGFVSPANAADGLYFPVDDAVQLEAGAAYLIDVLANDENTPPDAGDTMIILVDPACGDAAREEGMVSYAADASCVGVQTLTYCVPQGDVCVTGNLTVEVLPDPTGPVTSGADPTLTAGGAARDFTGESATPQFGMDDGGFVGGLPSPMGALGGPGAMAGMGAPGAGLGPVTGPSGGEIAIASVEPDPEPAPAPQPAADAEADADAPAAAAAGQGGFRDDPDDPALGALPAVAAVSAPGVKKKRKPRSVYASPAIDGFHTQSPERRAAMGTVSPAPSAAGGGYVVSTPLQRVRLTAAEALRRGSPANPEPDERSVSLSLLGDKPQFANFPFMSWSELGDRNDGRPAAQPISPLAEFGEVLSLAAAPPTDWTLPEPGELAEVAALWGMNSGWLRNELRETPPDPDRDADSMEPLTGLITTKPHLSIVDGFYRMVQLDPHGRHMRLTPASGGEAPRADAAPAVAVPAEPEPTAEEIAAAAEIREAFRAAIAAAGPAPAPTTPVDCPVTISAFPASGGYFDFEAVSPCRAGRVGLLEMEGIRVAMRFDDAGVIAESVPGLARDMRLHFETSDGVAAEASVTLLDSGAVLRTALVWSDPVELRLHAFEYGAGLEDAGHVWAGSEQDMRGYRRGVNGVLSSFPALDGLGDSIEVYSFNPGRRSQTGKLSLAVEYASRGAVAAAPYCEGEEYASPYYRIYHFNDGEIDTGAQRVLQAVPCNEQVPQRDLYVTDGVQDLLVLNR